QTVFPINLAAISEALHCSTDFCALREILKIFSNRRNFSQSTVQKKLTPSLPTPRGNQLRSTALSMD
ncbi:hypothetical protein, partial [Comamonas humi]